jgi:hypothetical protein
MKIRLCLVALCCLMFQYQTAFSQTQKFADWEYKQIYNPTDEYLNFLAKEGWEIAATGLDANSYFKIIIKRPRTHRLFGTKTEDYPKPEPPPPNTACNLTLAQAPVIRGLRLGMTSDELFALFPANERETFDRAQRLKSAEIAPAYGYTTFQFNTSNYPGQDRFKGISGVSFGVFDNKIVSIEAGYWPTPQFDSITQLMGVITRQFKLPSFIEWPNPKDSWGIHNLGCDGFKVSINGNASSFTIGLFDSSYQMVVEERRKADLAKKREGFQL